MRSWIARRTLRAFAKRYGYDVSYLLMMLNESPAGFFKFAPLSKPTTSPPPPRKFSKSARPASTPTSKPANAS